MSTSERWLVISNFKIKYSFKYHVTNGYLIYKAKGIRKYRKIDSKIIAKL